MLYTFRFLTLLYFAVFSVVSARERHSFWSTMSTKALTGSRIADAITGAILTRVALPGLILLPWWQALAVFGYAIASCLVVNDFLQVAMIRWRVPSAIA